MPDEETYLSVSDIATKLHISEDTVRRWIREGALPALGLGGQYRVPNSDLQQFLAKRRRPLPSKPRKKPRK